MVDDSCTQLGCNTPKTWNSVFWFCSQSWFSKLWVMQEVNAGNEVILICDYVKVGWDTVGLAARYSTSQAIGSSLTLTIFGNVICGVLRLCAFGCSRIGTAWIFFTRREILEFPILETRHTHYPAHHPFLVWTALFMQIMRKKGKRSFEDSRICILAVPTWTHYPACSTIPIFHAV